MLKIVGTERVQGIELIQELELRQYSFGYKESEWLSTTTENCQRDNNKIKVSK